MRFKTTAYLFLLVLLVAGVLWRLAGQREVENQRRREAVRALEVNPERVTELLFERNGERIECRRVDGIWRVVYPVNARADEGEIGRTLALLEDLLRGEVITPRDRRESGVTLQDYGLERPRKRVAWRQDGGAWVFLLIGRESALGDDLYVMQQQSADVLSVPAQLLSVWPESVVSLRDRILFHGDPRRAERFEITRSDGFLQLRKSDDGTWAVQQPTTALADGLAVRQWLDRLFEWRVEKFVAESVSDTAVYGLDNSATRITVWTEGVEEGQSVWLGLLTDAQGDAVYARREDGTSVFTVPADMLDAARIRLNALRERALLPMPAHEIVRVRVQRGDSYVVLGRDGEGDWTIEGPRKWPADRARVEQLIAAWGGARIDDFIGESALDEEAPRFSDELLRIVFEVDPDTASALGDEDVAPGSVSIRVSDESDEDGYLLVQRNGAETLHKIEDRVLAVTAWDALHYQHRRILDLDRDAVLRVRQIYQGVECVLERDSEGAFRMESQVDGTLNEEVLSSAIETLVNLEADEIIADAPEEWATYGLDSPRVVWELGLKADAGIRRAVMLGDKRSDGRVYARTRGQDLLFLLSPSDSTLLLQKLVDVDVDELQEDSGELESEPESDVETEGVGEDAVQEKDEEENADG